MSSAPTISSAFPCIWCMVDQAREERILDEKQTQKAVETVLNGDTIHFLQDPAKGPLVFNLRIIGCVVRQLKDSGCSVWIAIVNNIYSVSVT